MTYSAQGGLALASMEDSLFFERMARASEGEFQWHRGTRDTLHVRFLAGEEMRAFAWTAPDEATRRARGCDRPYTVRELNFSSGDVHLSRAAFLPTDTGPHPGVVMIHGSGTSDRDNFWYLQIAHHLAKPSNAVRLPTTVTAVTIEMQYRDEIPVLEARGDGQAATHPGRRRRGLAPTAGTSRSLSPFS